MDIINENEYFFHGTTFARFKRMNEDGLIKRPNQLREEDLNFPSRGKRNSIYVVTSIKKARTWAHIAVVDFGSTPVVLCIPRESLRQCKIAPDDCCYGALRIVGYDIPDFKVCDIFLEAKQIWKRES